MRGAILRNTRGGEENFAWRGRDISRIENLSDAVFGFAITLLVVSLEVPTTMDGLYALVRGFIPFGITVVILGMIWHAHYTFYRRYGLNDGVTMLINAVLLFVVVFYLYPLKFLVTLLFSLLFSREAMEMTYRDGANLLIIYSLGYAAVFGTLTAFYLQAWRRRADLELTPVERAVTKMSIGLLSVHVATALLTTLMAVITRQGYMGGIFFLIGPASYFVGSHFGKEIDRLKKAPPAVEPAPAGATD